MIRELVFTVEGSSDEIEIVVETLRAEGIRLRKSDRPIDRVLNSESLLRISGELDDQLTKALDEENRESCS